MTPSPWPRHTAQEGAAGASESVPPGPLRRPEATCLGQFRLISCGRSCQRDLQGCVTPNDGNHTHVALGAPPFPASIEHTSSSRAADISNSATAETVLSAASVCIPVLDNRASGPASLLCTLCDFEYAP